MCDIWGALGEVAGSLPRALARAAFRLLATFPSHNSGYVNVPHTGFSGWCGDGCVGGGLWLVCHGDHLAA